MNLKDFKAGALQQEYKYKSFLPEMINHTFTWNDPQINTMLEDATRALGELNAFTMIVPNVDIFIQMHITKEANTSSKIEGTKTQMDEVLISKEQIDPEKRDDWQEVRNYVDAMNMAIKELENIPISNRLIRNIHETLLNSVRGASKQPGEFRKSQNWIGGASLATAYFIPPHHDKVNELMGDLEKFLHNEEIFVPHLIKIAIAHYQFETIHPFLDGNGRIGRLLIPLYLVSNGLLKKPSLYLSDFIEKNKSAYYEALTNVRTTNDIIHWIKFFLEAVIVTANSGVETFQTILNIKQDMDTKVIEFGKKAHNASKLIEFLYQKPILNINDIVEKLDIAKTTASLLVKDFEEKDILKEITGYQRNKHYAFSRYLDAYSSS
ncbi:MAG: Fic family protein [Sulfurimonas sp.]|uniref:Fic family protein n=1 Tax=Sulfurimonas sp. TaxID=2022749 RepID=UPI0025F9BA8E|nr:Fic family protein [Sulfurimonas sp.]MCK9492327.1 Fic family protein [Sulfurimonas sp.]